MGVSRMSGQQEVVLCREEPKTRRDVLVISTLVYVYLIFPDAKPMLADGLCTATLRSLRWWMGRRCNITGLLDRDYMKM